MKTSRSRRTLSIPRFISDLLADQLGTAPESEFVFSSPCGDILNYRNFRRRFWDPAMAQADLVGVTPHALRHTCVALMIAEGANPLMVQRQLGHADLRMTLSTYGHLSPTGIATSRIGCRSCGSERKRPCEVSQNESGLTRGLYAA